MNKDQLSGLLATPLAALLGACFAFAGSGGAPFANGLHPFALAVLLAFVINWLAFIPAFAKQTEKFYDLTGSLTYISIALIAYVMSGHFDAYATVAMLLVMVWAARLGLFLARRIHKAGKDGRFDEVKTSFVMFLMAWSLQAAWVTFTASAALAAITSTTRPEFGPIAFIGLAVWACGFCFEVVADWQKSRFTSNPANAGRFINVGLWSVSRHPNYFGEIVIWVGMAIFAFPALSVWQYWTLLSPVFVATLLIFGSGIPPLEKRADRKWGGQPDYEEYKRTTPVLVPRP